MVLSSWQSHCESSPGSFDECRTAPSSRRPKTKPDDLGCESACTGCQNLHPPSPFIIITQLKSWYSFYRPTEGRRLSWPSKCYSYHARYIQGEHSPDNVTFPDGSRHSAELGMLSVTYIMPVLVLNTCMDTNMQFIINSSKQLFPDEIFSLTFPWLLVKSLTFPWQLSNSPTFPGFPDKWSPCIPSCGVCQSVCHIHVSYKNE